MAKKFRKGINGKAHKEDHPGYNVSNGRNESLLVEPVPEYFHRPGDGEVSAKTSGGYNNNATIIFGRDRTGLGEKDGGYNLDKGLDETNSLGIGSYGDYMGAGAIDIVVGRGAPFPVQNKGYSLGPLFNTQYDIKELKKNKNKLSGSLPSPFDADHPAYAMDAARIYISQMTNVDYNFNITDVLTEDDSFSDASGYGIKLPAPPPSSAIVAKSDKVRIHAREDVKIVTGGSSETVNSQGEPILVKGGIHLIAQNERGKQQPIPLGNNLESCLDEILELLGNVTTTIKRFATEQMAYNDAISRHWHFSTPGVPTTFDPVLGPQGVKTVVHQFGYVVLQCDKATSNLEYIRAEYLSPGGNPGDDDSYINSPYNTTN